MCLFRLRDLSLLVALAGVAAAQPLPSESFDVVIVGGSSGGVGAAIGAGRLGVKVALVEDTPVLGGMLSNGISNIDSYSYESLSGVFEEFRQAVKQTYRSIEDTDPVFKKADGMPRHMDSRSFAAHDPIKGGVWEPHVSDRIFKSMVAKLPNIKVFYRTNATDVLRTGNRVTGVVIQTGSDKRVLRGKVVVDATHEADIAAWAGAPYRVGREPRSPLEPHAGEVYFFNHTGEFLPGSNGRQDPAIVSYGLRLCIKTYGPNDGDAHVLKSPPPGYNPDKYIASSYSGTPGMPNSKAEMNVNPVGSELQEVNWSWPDATPDQRRKLSEVYKNHALGFLYFLQHERGLKQLGLPKDEFTDNGNVPYRVFVREARRIEGEVTMTEADINPFITGATLMPTLQPTSIAVGHYPIDAKPVRAKTDLSRPDKGNGDFYLVNSSTAFQVPYGAIIPKNVDGLIVPVALSATHVAFSSIRMDPTWTVLGQAAGVAAALAARSGVEPRRMAVGDIQQELLKQKCKLVFYWDLNGDHPNFDAIQRLSLAGIATGDEDRLFRPDAPLTRAQVASMLVRAFEIWPSVSNSHFTDVTYKHPAFRDVETLFDNALLAVFGMAPRWQDEGGYVASKHAGFRQLQGFGNFEPDRPVTKGEVEQLIHIASARTVTSPARVAPETPAAVISQDTSPITRGEACARFLTVYRRAQ
jgi:hypothetical protein